MGYAQFVGRVGALAVALGVTNVVGHPLIAWAEEPSAESSNTDSAPSTGTPSTGTPDKPSETQSPDPTTAPTRDPVDTEDADATDVETGTDVSVVETSYPTTTPAPEVEESTAPEPDVVTDDAPETKDPHPTETEPAPTATDTDDSPETTDQYRFVAQALAVSGVNEHSLDAPLPMPLAIPVAADLATSSAAPEAAVSITKVDPVTVEEAHPFRSLVLGFLGIFGFDPTPGATNDALLTALWAAYRGYERRFENETPTVSGATILSTSHTENGYTAVTISVGFTDPDGDTLHYTTTNGHNGTLTANTDGTFTYLTNTIGTDTVTITANDDDGTGHLHGLLGWLFKPAAGHTRTVTLSLNITGSTNHAPVGTDDTATTNEDTPVVIHVLTNDTDPDNDPLSIGSFSHGAHGTVTQDGDTLTYTPDQNYNGTDEFSYTTTDGTLTDTATVTITVKPVKHAPTITVDIPNSDTGTVAGTITAGSTVTLATQATKGTASVNEHGTFTYTPTLIERLRAATNPTNDTFTVSVGGTTYAVDVPVSAARYATTKLINLSDPTHQNLDQPALIGYASGRAFVANAPAGQVQAIDLATGALVGTPISVTDPLGVLGVDDRVYIGASSDGQIIALDATTLAKVGTIALQDNSGGTLNDVTGNPNRISAYGTKLVVTSDNANAIFIVDPSTSDVTAIAIPTPSRGMAIIGDTAYVLAPPPADTNTRSSAYAVNLTTGTVDTLDVGYGAGDITAAGGKLYVANFSSDSVTVINNGVITDSISVTDGPFSITTSPDGTHVVVISVATDSTPLGGGVATVIDTNAAGYAVLGSFIVPQGSYLASFGPDGQIYISSSLTDDVYVARVVAANDLPAVSDSSAITTGSSLPIGVALSPDGTRAYVTNTADLEGNAGNTVSVIDTASGSVIGDPITVGATPGALAVSPDGAHVYVVCGDGTVSVIDTATSTVVPITISTALSGGIAISPDGAWVYVADAANDRVAVINSATNAVTGIAVGLSPSDVAVNSVGTRVYVANAGDASVSVIDTIHGTVSTIDIPGGPLLGNIAISPDDRTLYVTSPGDYQLFVIDTNTAAVIAAVPLGAIAPGDVIFSPDGSFALVAAGDALTVIDTATNTVAENISAGGTGISTIAFAGDGTVYVTTLFDDDLNPAGKLTTISFTAPNTVAAEEHQNQEAEFIVLDAVATPAVLTAPNRPKGSDLFSDPHLLSALDLRYYFANDQIQLEYWYGHAEKDLTDIRNISGPVGSGYYESYSARGWRLSWTLHTSDFKDPSTLDHYDFYVVTGLIVGSGGASVGGVPNDDVSYITGVSALGVGGTVFADSVSVGLLHGDFNFGETVVDYGYTKSADLMIVPKGYFPDVLRDLPPRPILPVPPVVPDPADPNNDPTNGPVEKKWEKFKHYTGWIPVVGQLEAAISLGFDDVQIAKDLFTGNLDDAKDESADIKADLIGLIPTGKIAGKVITRIPGAKGWLIGKDLQAAADGASTLDGTGISKIGGLK